MAFKVVLSLLFFALFPLQLQAYEGSVKDHCEAKWGGNSYRMVKYCVDQEQDAGRYLDAYFKSSNKTIKLITTRCWNKWEANSYNMVKYCIDQEFEAFSAINR